MKYVSFLKLKSEDVDDEKSKASSRSTSTVLMNHESYRKLKYLHQHFLYFAAIASLNHALAYVVVAYSSSVLDGTLASIILGLSWILNALSGLFISSYLTKSLGYKYAMVLSLWGFTIQIICLYISILDSTIAWPVAISGSIFSGLTSAVWWTAQGVCFETTCEQIFEIELEHQEIETENNLTQNPITLNSIRANLSARWTLIYQSADIVVFMSLSILPLFLSVSFENVMLGLSLLGIVTSILGLSFDSLGNKGIVMSPKEICQSILSVPEQFVYDARASLIAPFVFGFGITTAMFAYYVNGKVIDDASGFGLLYIGLLEAFSYFVAAVAACPYAYVSTHVRGGAHAVMQFGSLSFLLTGLVVLVCAPGQLSSWGPALTMRGLYGLGRGVFEGACRAVYADLFQGDTLSIAFSAQTLLAGLSGGVCFLLYDALSRPAIASITVANGVIAIASYALLLTHDDMMKPIRWSHLFTRINPPLVNGGTSADVHSPLLSFDRN